MQETELTKLVQLAMLRHDPLPVTYVGGFADGIVSMLPLHQVTAIILGTPVKLINKETNEISCYIYDPLNDEKDIKIYYRKEIDDDPRSR